MRDIRYPPYSLQHNKNMQHSTQESTIVVIYTSMQQQQSRQSPQQQPEGALQIVQENINY